MLAAGVQARTIMEVPGHSEIGMTMNTYTSRRGFAMMPPTRSTGFPGTCNPPVGSSAGNSRGLCPVRERPWHGAVGGTRTPSLLIRSNGQAVQRCL
jgi:hypothetical protein